MRTHIQHVTERLEALSTTKPLKIISHYDTDGITAAAIVARALQRLNKSFSLEIVKNLDEQCIAVLPDTHVLVFLDLASASLHYLKEKKTDVFILDHHEFAHPVPENVTLINPLLFHEEPLSGAGLAYLLAKALSPHNTDLAYLAVIGMVGDVLDKNVSKLYDEILKDADVTVKRGLLLYPSTRPLDRALEYSSQPYIPGVSGSYRGAIELLREANITKFNGRYKSLHELTDNEMSALVTAIMLRYAAATPPSNLLGNLFLVKFFNKLEDARELSALINACSRMGFPETALGFCLGNKKAKEEAERIYIDYKHHLMAALRTITELEKIAGRNYMIINAKNAIKDTIIGTVASIISNSPAYAEGTIIIALAYHEDKIKVSARIAGRTGRNVREVLARAMMPIGGEVGGHPNAAGCLLSRDKEAAFIAELQKVLEIELVKV